MLEKENFACSLALLKKHVKVSISEGLFND